MVHIYFRRQILSGPLAGLTVRDEVTVSACNAVQWYAGKMGQLCLTGSEYVITDVCYEVEN
ncbi:MAG: hypothetical protein WC742_15415 [Gallionellaceae bacterium]|jgi:hypothetical protein